MKFKLTYFEVKKFGEDMWQEVPEKIFLEKIVDCFDPVSPILEKILQGNEIVANAEIYRTRT
jgi:hypothetical protein